MTNQTNTIPNMLFVSDIKRYLEQTLCQIYWNKPIFFQKLWPSTFLFGHVANGCHRLHESHLLPLRRTYLHVLEQWKFLVSNFTLSLWILGPAFDLYRLFILKNIHMYMDSTHIVAKVCSVLCGGSCHDAFSCNSKSQYSPTSVQKVFFCRFRLCPKTCS